MSHKGRPGRMSESSGAVSGAVILEEPEVPGASGAGVEGPVPDRGPLRCAVWPRQQTWLCVVPLLIGFVGLGLSLMLLKWIVVGTVRDYVPTDLVDANRIGQDPIFLSKPSGVPKSPDTTTTTTTTPTVDGGGPSSRTATVGKGRARSPVSTTTSNPRGGGASQVTPRNPSNRNGRGPWGFATTAASPRTTSGNGTASPSPPLSKPTVLHDSTQTWTPDRVATGAAPTVASTRTHGHHKTPPPTTPPLHSEHFKPCQEKDLSYCLNGGECFVIETLSGPHKHCRCQEGYQGIRCDQFLPKTDSILSDPNHLGIEFMESKDVYRRQVLSIASIAMAISLLGTLCMALYCRNKKRREKLQAHLKESRSLKSYTSNSHDALGAKTSPPHGGLQMHEFCKRTSLLHHQGADGESSYARCNVSTPARGGARAPAKHHRSGSLSRVSDHRSRTSHWSAPRRTPPTVRGRLNPIGGTKYSGPTYQHLQEADSSEKNEAQNGGQSQRRGEARPHMQTPPPTPSPQGDGRRPGSGHAQPIPTRPERRHARDPAPPFRSCSIPIIPSIQCRHDNEGSCMQTGVSPAPTLMSVACRDDREDQSRSTPSSSLCSSLIGRQRDEVALLLEEAQAQLRALARRKQEGGAGASTSGLGEARESVCFLNVNGEGGAGGRGCNGPTQTQLLSPSQSERPGPRQPIRD
ncbi:pro-neuregulin-3, membrane-bound isoform [Antennarius striatus]|uniref:pro-neuregulin-3, membrane-bound isoform n=1 Tax=Antennarius striatus TaxID=241820 RepID=UPI0035B4E925